MSGHDLTQIAVWFFVCGSFSGLIVGIVVWELLLRGIVL